MSGDHIKSPEYIMEIMTTYTTLQVLLNVANTDIVNGTSEMKQLESSICDIAIEATYLVHGIANIPEDILLSNFKESVKYINRLSEKYFHTAFFKDDDVVSVLEVLDQHNIEYESHPIHVDRLIDMIKNA